MSSLYEKLMKQAQKEKISLVNSNSRLLKRMYEEIAINLIKRSKSARGGFTKAWLKDFEKYVEYRYKQLNNDIAKLVEDSIISSGEIASAVEGDFLSYISMKYKLDIPKELVNNMYGINQDVILRMISGDYYKNGAGVSKSIWRYSEINKSDINYIIAKGMAEQKTFIDIIGDLEKYVDPGAKKSWDFSKVYPNLKNGRKATVDFNAQRLLRTSINHTFYSQMMDKANKNPFVNAIHWSLSSSHYSRQVNHFGEDVCDQYASQDDYGLGQGNFPKDNVPIPHPCCLCSQYPVNADSLDKIAEEIGGWLRGKSSSRLDEWFKGDA